MWKFYIWYLRNDMSTTPVEMSFWKLRDTSIYNKILLFRLFLSKRFTDIKTVSLSLRDTKKLLVIPRMTFSKQNSRTSPIRLLPPNNKWFILPVHVAVMGSVPHRRNLSRVKRKGKWEFMYFHVGTFPLPPLIPLYRYL